MVDAEEVRRKSNRFLEYDKFEDKFVQKKTTDDCYTPPAVYKAIIDELDKAATLKNQEKNKNI